jgi:arylsulfatase A-like enzyme
MKKFMKFHPLGIVATVILACSLGVSAQQKPNIIFILADDLGWQDVGFMGSKYFETPHLDALAKESLVFENAFMYPTCSPSRAAIFTGQQSFRTGCYTVPVLEKGNDKDNIFSKWTVGTEHPIYSEPLNAEGYKLIHLGKYHIVGPYPEKEGSYPFHKKLNQPGNGDFSWVEHHKSPEIAKFYPTGRGFHENVGGTWWGDPARGYDKGYASESGGYIAPFNNPFIEVKDGDEWLTDRLTSDAIDFIERHKEEPFFVNLNFYAPHMPSVARNEEWLKHFMDKPTDEATGQGKGKRGGIAAYATMIRSIDDNLKRLTDYLDANGLRENTVIIFTSDNGFNGVQSKNDNLRGAKGNIYDGGLRVPSLINWKGTVAPGKNAEPIQGLDYFPTLIELAGITGYEGVLDGASLVPLMKGESMGGRSLFWHLASAYKDPPCSVIRQGDWKLIQFLKKGNIELYNTGDDLKESKDLAKQNPERAEAMLKELVAWRKENDVPLPPSSVLEN